MDIVKAGFQDLDEIMKIYEDARAFMAENGNIVQWVKDGHPKEELIRQDIEAELCYICVDAGEILGVFFYEFADDETYNYIEDGEWLDDEPYAVVHRIAVKRGTNGIGAYCLDWAYNTSGNLRIDTHEDNKPMQKLLNKLGFKQCGTIYISADRNIDDKRIAYQKKKEIRF